MHFDPSIAAQQALHHAEEEGELGDLREEVVEAEETFSATADTEATEAYARLQNLGERLPQARYFQEFLIYITWQQVTEETIPRYFRKGAELCDRFLERFARELEGSDTLRQVRDIRASFRGGLGETGDAGPAEHDEDAFKGGD